MIDQLRALMVEFGIPADLLWLLLGLIVIQLVLQVAALIDLVRRPHVTLGDRKWAWLLIILLGESLGAILYFALGRVKYAPGEGPVALVDRAAAEDKAQRIVDKLYGDKSEQS